MPITTENMAVEARGSFLDRIRLNRFLPIQKMQEDAIAFARSIGTRWDIIQGERKPDQADDDDELYVKDEDGNWKIWAWDLRDVKSRFYRTAPDADGNQGSVAGRLLSQDLLMGSPSSATGLLFAAIPFFSLLTVLFLPSADHLRTASGGDFLLPFVTAMGMVITLVMLFITTVGWAFGAAILGALPLMSLALPDDMGDPTKLLASSAVLIPMGLALGAAFLFGSLRHARTTFLAILGVAFVLMLSMILPPYLRPLVLALPSAWCGTMWSSTLMIHRTAHLQWQEMVCGYEKSANGLFHIAARKAQTLRAAKEQTQ